MNGFKFIALAVVFFSLSACSTVKESTLIEKVSNSSSQHYRPADGGDQLKIQGNIDASYYQFALERPYPTYTLYIDDQEAIKGQLDFDYVGEISGEYDGMIIDSTCSSQWKSRTYREINCLVHINNERAATLTF